MLDRIEHATRGSASGNARTRLTHALPRAFQFFFFVLFIGLIFPAAPALATDITITNPPTATVTHDVCGNSTDAAQGNCSSLNADDGNTVSIGTGVSLPTYNVYGRWDQTGISAAIATDNQVSIDGSVLGGYGGLARSTQSGWNATATTNHVTIGTGANVSLYLQGGYALCHDNCAAKGSNNTVTVAGGTVQSGGAVYGGQSFCTVAPGCTSEASGNTVTITGGTLTGVNIFGGSAGPNFVDAALTAKNNIVDISGNPVMSGGRLYGGYVADLSGTSTGNILYLRTSGVSVTLFNFFQEMDFFVPATLGAGGTMLTVTATPPNISGVDISIAVASGSPLKVNDEIVLINSPSGAIGGLPPAGTVINSMSSAYSFETVASTNQLRVKVTNAPAPSALTFTDSAAYDIPASTVGTAIADIDVTGGASGGTTPYTFTATGLPAGISITTAGVIHGTPTATSATGGTATITVKDSAGATKDITIAYGAIAAAPAKTVVVGSQTGTRTTGTTGAVTYTVTTTGIANGTAIALNLNGAPAGITLGTAATTGNTTTVTINVDATVAAGTYSALTLTIDGVTSAPFSLAVLGASAGATAVPTLGELSLALLGLLLAGGVAARMRRREG